MTQATHMRRYVVGSYFLSFESATILSHLEEVLALLRCVLLPSISCVFAHVTGDYYEGQKLVWGDWSVESQYVTLGPAAAPAQAAAAAPAASASSKKERKKVPEKKAAEKKMSSAAAQQAALDEQIAIQQLKVGFQSKTSLCNVMH